MKEEMSSKVNALETKIREQDEIIRTLHTMAENNERQAVGEIKDKIFSGIKYVVADLNSGAEESMDDATKAEFYKSLLEDVFQTLRSAGIAV